MSIFPMKTTLRLLALVMLAFAAALTNTSCQTRLDPAGAYANNPTLYATDASITAAFAVLDVFMKFQHENRATLSPKVNEFADRTRRDAPQWAKSIVTLRDAYAASPTNENKVALNNVLRLVRVAITQASSYLVSQPVATPPTP